MSKRKPDSDCQWFGLHNPGNTVLVDVVRKCGHNSTEPIRTCIIHLQELMATNGLAKNAAPCPECNVIQKAKIAFSPEAQIVIRQLTAHQRGDHMHNKLGPDMDCYMCQRAEELAKTQA